MSFFLPNKKRIKGVFIQNAPNTYDADITAPEMQRGKTAWVKGKKVVGTGKAFERAGYGTRRVLRTTDLAGNEKYGISIATDTPPNILFLAPTTTGDIPLQTTHLLELPKNEAVTIGINQSTTGEVKAFYDGERFCVYFEDIENTKTKLIYFYGKDNQS